MAELERPTLRELARQALSSTERGYDLLAPKFDATPYRTSDALLALVADRLAGRGPFAHVLDLGCGTGAAARALRPLATERVLGLDFSRGMLAVCRERVAADERAGAAGTGVPVELVRGDLLALPFAAASVDLAICTGALGHVRRRDEARFVAGIARVLRPGGLLALVTSTPPPVLSGRHLRARAFNAAMHLRNALRRPPFVMFYLGFPWPGVGGVLAAAGLSAEAFELEEGGARRLVLATR